MKKFLFLAAALLVAIQAWASPVDVRTAQSHAQRFMQQKLYSGYLMAPISGELKLAHAEMNSKMLDRAVYYVFNTNNGFVIVSGDDRAEQVLAWGDGSIDMNNLPCGLQWMLNQYKMQMEWLHANPLAQVETSRQRLAGADDPFAVPPMLTCTWSPPVTVTSTSSVTASSPSPTVTRLATVAVTLIDVNRLKRLMFVGP